MAQDKHDQTECPLCMEPLEMDDINFYPCTCGYQICRFCWHRIRTNENGLCPACRKQYPEDPAEYKPLTTEELHKIRNEKRQKDLQKKQKVSENRKLLSQVRVVQKNLLFVVGLTQKLADPETLKKHENFGRFGKINKIVINTSTAYAGTGGPTASAYITYYKSDDALRAVQYINQHPVMDGRSVKASLGTTKYCSHFLKGSTCPKPDCMYLHEMGEEGASFTKEEMQAGKHQEYEMRLLENCNPYQATTTTQNNNSVTTSLLQSSPASTTTSPTISSRTNNSITSDRLQKSPIFKDFSGKSNEHARNIMTQSNETLHEHESGYRGKTGGITNPLISPVPDHRKHLYQNFDNNGNSTDIDNRFGFSTDYTYNNNNQHINKYDLATSIPLKSNTSHNNSSSTNTYNVRKKGSLDNTNSASASTEYHNDFNQNSNNATIGNRHHYNHSYGDYGTTMQAGQHSNPSSERMRRASSNLHYSSNSYASATTDNIFDDNNNNNNDSHPSNSFTLANRRQRNASHVITNNKNNDNCSMNNNNNNNNNYSSTFGSDDISLLYNSHRNHNHNNNPSGKPRNFQHSDYISSSSSPYYATDDRENNNDTPTFLTGNNNLKSEWNSSDTALDSVGATDGIRYHKHNHHQQQQQNSKSHHNLLAASLPGKASTKNRDKNDDPSFPENNGPEGAEAPNNAINIDHHGDFSLVSSSKTNTTTTPKTISNTEILNLIREINSYKNVGGNLKDHGKHEFGDDILVGQQHSNYTDDDGANSLFSHNNLNSSLFSNHHNKVTLSSTLTTSNIQHSQPLSSFDDINIKIQPLGAQHSSSTGGRNGVNKAFSSTSFEDIPSSYQINHNATTDNHKNNSTNNGPATTNRFTYPASDPKSKAHSSTSTTDPTSSNNKVKKKIDVLLLRDGKRKILPNHVAPPDTPVKDDDPDHQHTLLLSADDATIHSPTQNNRVGSSATRNKTRQNIPEPPDWQEAFGFGKQHKQPQNKYPADHFASLSQTNTSNNMNDHRIRNTSSRDGVNNSLMRSGTENCGDNILTASVKGRTNGEVAKEVDDDLGFDPWNESTKALEELIQIEERQQQLTKKPQQYMSNNTNDPHQNSILNEKTQSSSSQSHSFNADEQRLQLNNSLQLHNGLSNDPTANPSSMALLAEQLNALATLNRTVPRELMDKFCLLLRGDQANNSQQGSGVSDLTTAENNIFGNEDANARKDFLASVLSNSLPAPNNINNNNNPNNPLFNLQMLNQLNNTAINAPNINALLLMLMAQQQQQQCASQQQSPTHNGELFNGIGNTACLPPFIPPPLPQIPPPAAGQPNQAASSAFTAAFLGHLASLKNLTGTGSPPINSLLGKGGGGLENNFSQQIPALDLSYPSTNYRHHNNNNNTGSNGSSSNNNNTLLPPLPPPFPPLFPPAPQQMLYPGGPNNATTSLPPLNPAGLVLPPPPPMSPADFLGALNTFGPSTPADILGGNKFRSKDDSFLPSSSSNAGATSLKTAAAHHLSMLKESLGQTANSPDSMGHASNLLTSQQQFLQQLSPTFLNTLSSLMPQNLFLAHMRQQMAAGASFNNSTDNSITASNGHNNVDATKISNNGLPFFSGGLEQSLSNQNILDAATFTSNNFGNLNNNPQHFPSQSNLFDLHNQQQGSSNNNAFDNSSNTTNGNHNNGHSFPGNIPNLNSLALLAYGSGGGGSNMNNLNSNLSNPSVLPFLFNKLMNAGYGPDALKDILAAVAISTTTPGADKLQHLLSPNHSNNFLDATNNSQQNFFGGGPGSASTDHLRGGICPPFPLLPPPLGLLPPPGQLNLTPPAAPLLMDSNVATASTTTTSPTIFDGVNNQQASWSGSGSNINNSSALAALLATTLNAGGGGGLKLNHQAQQPNMEALLAASAYLQQHQQNNQLPPPPPSLLSQKVVLENLLRFPSANQHVNSGDGTDMTNHVTELENGTPPPFNINSNNNANPELWMKTLAAAFYNNNGNPTGFLNEANNNNINNNNANYKLPRSFSGTSASNTSSSTMLDQQSPSPSLLSNFMLEAFGKYLPPKNNADMANLLALKKECEKFMNQQSNSSTRQSGIDSNGNIMMENSSSSVYMNGYGESIGNNTGDNMHPSPFKTNSSKYSIGTQQRLDALATDTNSLFGKNVGLNSLDATNSTDDYGVVDNNASSTS